MAASIANFKNTSYRHAVEVYLWMPKELHLLYQTFPTKANTFKQYHCLCQTCSKFQNFTGMNNDITAYTNLPPKKTLEPHIASLDGYF